MGGLHCAWPKISENPRKPGKTALFYHFTFNLLPRVIHGVGASGRTAWLCPLALWLCSSFSFNNLSPLSEPINDL